MTIELDLISLLLGTALGTLAGTWFAQLVIRPKLETNGGGSTDLIDASVRTVGIHIWNRPGFIGFPNELELFGRTVLRRFSAGLLIDRAIARGCYAVIFDADTQQSLGRAHWVIDGKLRETINLDAGETGQLLLFARNQGVQTEYFVCKFDGRNHERIWRPSDMHIFRSTKRFRVDIYFSHGFRKYSEELRMVLNQNGRLEFFMSDGSGGSF